MAIQVSSASSKKSHSRNGSSMLGLGARGARVVALQKMLRAAGFNPSGIDGKFGPKTLAALRAFQRAARIVIDGRAGPQTFGAFKSWFARGNRAPSSAGGSASSSTSVHAPAGATASTSAPPSAKLASMLVWARSMLGSKYAAVNPFRFGDVLWDGKPHTSVNGSGTVYNFPKGTRVFDCSGFVVAAFRKLGVDLAAKGLFSTSTFHANAGGFLQNVSRSNLRPGDLVMYQPRNGIGHVVIYMGDGKVIEAKGGKGVVISQLEEDRIKSIRRVPL